jgi:hypothetical protein
MSQSGRELPHALPDTGHSASSLCHVSWPIRDFAGSLCSKRSCFRDTDLSPDFEVRLELD